MVRHFKNLAAKMQNHFAARFLKCDHFRIIWIKGLRLKLLSFHIKWELIDDLSMLPTVNLIGLKILSQVLRLC